MGIQYWKVAAYHCACLCCKRFPKIKMRLGNDQNLAAREYTLKNFFTCGTKQEVYLKAWMGDPNTSTFFGLSK